MLLNSKYILKLSMLEKEELIIDRVLGSRSVCRTVLKLEFVPGNK